MKKPFSSKLYNANDNAKIIIKKWLESKGIKAWINPDDYGIDILTDNYQFEVEVKHNWLGDKFPFGSVHFPQRKIKFAKEIVI